MTQEALTYLNDKFEELDIPYEFMSWTTSLSFPYFVGEYTEVEPMNEDGYERSTFILTGTTNSSYGALEAIKNVLKTIFDGSPVILDSGSALVVEYSTAFPVRTGEDGLYRMQINLNIKEWKGEDDG